MKAKKSMMKRVKKGSTELTAARKDEAADFLLLKKIVWKEKPV
ncbi:hypothetical protein Hanom_Chr14g01319561 [Helianthus anomalus]